MTTSDDNDEEEEEEEEAEEELVQHGSDTESQRYSGDSQPTRMTMLFQ